MPGIPYHTPVLAEEAVSFLVNAREGVFVDGTLGGGGHAESILRKSEPHGRLIGIDADDDALRVASQRLAAFGERLILRRGNFRDIKEIVAECGVRNVAGVLLDLGVSSHQLDEPSRGFSFSSDAPLDMRMSLASSLTAREVVNSYEEGRLAGILKDLGEEHNARKIARAIVQARTRKPLDTGKDLTRVLERTVGDRFLTKTLARVFQAIRIEVNGELDSLKRGLSGALDILTPGGRLVVISYHSLEDRIVKETFRAASATTDTTLSKFLPPTVLKPSVLHLTKKFVGPSESEIRSNPRARSAKLRAVEKL
ncbi:MAG TPA: 16S rRNA (cytosine(1402)-N(4))-methyltransferase RsmH [Bacteroidota bacterium]|nr:16S rRNA (cytosine(1402)-N(4))-methyltransferase RsmH [Bacteroidota bacterium]